MSDENVEALARGVLDRHQYALGAKSGSICTCGFVPTVDPASLQAQQDYHRAHLAQALAPVLAAAVREGKAEAWDFGYACGLGDYGKADDETKAANPYRADRIAGDAPGGGASRG